MDAKNINGYVLAVTFILLLLSTGQNLMSVDRAYVQSSLHLLKYLLHAPCYERSTCATVQENYGHISRLPAISLISFTATKAECKTQLF